MSDGFDDFDAFDPPQDDEDDEQDFEIEDSLEECGQTGTGPSGCQMGGTEYCDFECPYRNTNLLSNYP